MKDIDPNKIVIDFNDCINNRDINGLEKLMSDNHRFIDTENRQINGKQNCLAAWSEFFRLFPDYKNIFEKVTPRENMVIVTGRSTCSDKRLEGSAIWTAKILNNKIEEWQVYKDTIDNRQKLHISLDKKY